MAQDENSAPLEVGEIFEILKGIAPLLLILISTCFLYMCMKRETTQNKAKHPAEMEQVYSPKNNEERDQGTSNFAYICIESDKIDLLGKLRIWV